MLVFCCRCNSQREFVRVNAFDNSLSAARLLAVYATRSKCYIQGNIATLAAHMRIAKTCIPVDTFSVRRKSPYLRRDDFQDHLPWQFFRRRSRHAQLLQFGSRGYVANACCRQARGTRGPMRATTTKDPLHFGGHMRFDGSCEQSNIPQGARAATVFSHPSYVSPPLLASWPSMRKHNVIRSGGALRG